MFYAHSVKDRPKTDWELLKTHLEAVAVMAAEFSRRFGAEEWGRFIGTVHDAGKYRPEFQRRLEDDRIHAPHAAPGAAIFARNKLALPAAFVIAGHHTGLANFQDSSHGPTPLVEAIRSNTDVARQITETMQADWRIPDVPQLPQWITSCSDKSQLSRRLAFLTRMLFSALVDADRLETDSFYARVEGRSANKDALTYDTIPDLASRLDEYIDRLAVAARPSPVNELRHEVLESCRQASAESPGLFSLTVPTGGGKTLSGMSFALNHALQKGLDRVIVVIPYTSIITQNANEYKKAFGELDTNCGNVLEHHSGIDEQQRLEQNSEAEVRRRLAAENWDAPIVVTTTVQFFESLFSNHPSRCRKLHRIAGSVVILDEVQTLPPQYLLPIVDCLNELTTNYRCSVVLSTATPPALSRETLSDGLQNVRPIVPEFRRMFASSAARRVNTEWRIETEIPYADLAEELKSHHQVLAIVHLRKDARELAELLPDEGRFHLSALMCPAHRTKCIERIRKALQAGEPCRLISTQLIEAGVDVDFPVVYRALAGLDSLAQSAGRCDREGKRTEAAGGPAGRFIVFRAETSPPPGVLRDAMQTTELLFGMKDHDDRLNGNVDPFNPDHGTLFFEQLYRGLQKNKNDLLRETESFNFANVDAGFRMIDSAGMRPIVVDWQDGRERIEQFRREPDRQNARAMQPYVVQVNARYFAHVCDRGIVEPWFDGSLGLATDLFRDWYHEDFGLNPDPGTPLSPDVMVI
ncbi:MAG: CRISPR-associated helicase Cas3' [Planctomycetaceae bacterium]